MTNIVILYSNTVDFTSASKNINHQQLSTSTLSRSHDFLVLCSYCKETHHSNMTITLLLVIFINDLLQENPTNKFWLSNYTCFRNRTERWSTTEIQLRLYSVSPLLNTVSFDMSKVTFGVFNFTKCCLHSLLSIKIFEKSCIHTSEKSTNIASVSMYLLV